MSLALLAHWGVAQTISTVDLNGIELCLEPNSVHVIITETGAVENTKMMAFIQSKLETTLLTTLDRYDLPLIEKDSCESEQGFIYMFYIASWGQDNSGNPFLFHASTLQVGHRPDVLTADIETLLPQLKFRTFDRKVLFEPQLSESVYEDLSETAELMITQLANAWWNNYVSYQESKQAQQILWLKIGFAVSVLIASLMIAVSFWLRAQRRKS